MLESQDGAQALLPPPAPVTTSLPSLSHRRTARPWPTPLSDSAYLGLTGAIVRAIEPHTEADNAALVIQFLVAFGNSIGRSAHFEADGALHHTNLYTVLVGKTAKGRKGTSFRQMIRLFEAAQPEWAADRIKSGLASGEGLIWSVRDKITKREPVKSKGRITGEYDEVESDPGVQDKRLLVMESEFAQVLKVAQREGNTLSPLIRLAWDGGTLHQMVKNDPGTATNAHVSIIGHITEEELRRKLDPTEMANGFANRFLWACVDRSKCLPDGGNIDEVDFSAITQQLTGAVECARCVGLVTRDDEARALWHNVYPKLSEGRDGMFGTATSRAEAQVMRLAIVYALLDAERRVRRTHLEAALEIWRYCEDSARYLFGGSLGDRVADRILAALRGSADGLTRTDISRQLNNHTTAVEIDAALSLLRERNLARVTNEATNGRSAERWFVM